MKNLKELKSTIFGLIIIGSAGVAFYKQLIDWATFVAAIVLAGTYIFANDNLFNKPKA